MNIIDLASVSGICTLVILLVQLVKIKIGGTKTAALAWARAMPAWLWAIAFAAGLTWLAWTLGTLAVPAGLWAAMWQVTLNAAASSGLYEWLRSLNSPIADSTAAQLARWQAADVQGFKGSTVQETGGTTVPQMRIVPLSNPQSAISDPQSADSLSAAGEKARATQSFRSNGWMLLAPLAALLVLFSGCQVSTTADEMRLTAVLPAIREYQVNHPEQRQTWEDFVWSWCDSIESRGGRVPSTNPHE